MSTTAARPTPAAAAPPEQLALLPAGASAEDWQQLALARMQRASRPYSPLRTLTYAEAMADGKLAAIVRAFAAQLRTEARMREQTALKEQRYGRRVESCGWNVGRPGELRTANTHTTVTKGPKA